VKKKAKPLPCCEGFLPQKWGTKLYTQHLGNFFCNSEPLSRNELRQFLLLDKTMHRGQRHYLRSKVLEEFRKDLILNPVTLLALQCIFRNRDIEMYFRVERSYYFSLNLHFEEFCVKSSDFIGDIFFTATKGTLDIKSTPNSTVNLSASLGNFRISTSENSKLCDWKTVTSVFKIKLCPRMKTIVHRKHQSFRAEDMEIDVEIKLPTMTLDLTLISVSRLQLLLKQLASIDPSSKWESSFQLIKPSSTNGVQSESESESSTSDENFDIHNDINTEERMQTWSKHLMKVKNEVALVTKKDINVNVYWAITLNFSGGSLSQEPAYLPAQSFCFIFSDIQFHLKPKRKLLRQLSVNLRKPNPKSILHLVNDIKLSAVISAHLDSGDVAPFIEFSFLTDFFLPPDPDKRIIETKVPDSGISVKLCPSLVENVLLFSRAVMKHFRMLPSRRNSVSKLSDLLFSDSVEFKPPLDQSVENSFCENPTNKSIKPTHEPPGDESKEAKVIMINNGSTTRQETCFKFSFTTQISILNICTIDIGTFDMDIKTWNLNQLDLILIINDLSLNYEQQTDSSTADLQGEHQLLKPSKVKLFQLSLCEVKISSGGGSERKQLDLDNFQFLFLQSEIRNVLDVFLLFHKVYRDNPVQTFIQIDDPQCASPLGNDNVEHNKVKHVSSEIDSAKSSIKVTMSNVSLNFFDPNEEEKELRYSIEVSSIFLELQQECGDLEIEVRKISLIEKYAVLNRPDGPKIYRNLPWADIARFDLMTIITAEKLSPEGLKLRNIEVSVEGSEVIVLIRTVASFMGIIFNGSLLASLSEGGGKDWTDVTLNPKSPRGPGAVKVKTNIAIVFGGNCRIVVPVNTLSKEFFAINSSHIEVIIPSCCVSPSSFELFSLSVEEMVQQSNNNFRFPFKSSLECDPIIQIGILSVIENNDGMMKKAINSIITGKKNGFAFLKEAEESVIISIWRIESETTAVELNFQNSRIICLNEAIYTRLYSCFCDWRGNIYEKSKME
jgi:hypothetical protein